MLGVLERELTLGPDGEARYRERLNELAVEDESELARRIRDREVDATDDRLVTALWAITRDRLLVSNPKYLSGEVDDQPLHARA
ncbi:DUF6285 domain-containing protein [Dactylosporangium sp. NPDC048998]|uniref:DUF6285 domain-containing protein n=1 Tax=Dactylosporangium sp. NPDC048998 TaxID=3363976 RepID=UPI00371C387B